jgi:hypothetical protein
VVPHGADMSILDFTSPPGAAGLPAQWAWAAALHLSGQGTEADQMGLSNDFSGATGTSPASSKYAGFSSTSRGV